MKFAVCFCVHSGELEIKALLLAASLRKQWPATVDLIACVPQDPRFGGLSTNAARVLDSLDVRVTSVSNPIGADYPIANKLLCIDARTGADRIMFLDSDIMALETVTEQELATIFGTGFVAKPADLATFSADREVWKSIYHACEAGMPNFTVTSTVSGENMAPYFNAGVLAADANSGFGRLWSDCAVVIDALPEVPSKRPHLDQIALPVAAAKSGAKIKLLDEDWNFPAHLRPLPLISPKLCHYHWPEVIERQPVLLNAIEDLASGAAYLNAILGQDKKWRGVFKRIQPRHTTRRSKRLPVGVITGIPRSGTSFLCRLLHHLPNHAVINEPAEIFAPLNATHDSPFLSS